MAMPNRKGGTQTRPRSKPVVGAADRRPKPGDHRGGGTLGEGSSVELHCAELVTLPQAPDRCDTRTAGPMAYQPVCPTR